MLATEGRRGILQVARSVPITMSIFAQLYKESSHLEFVTSRERVKCFDVFVAIVERVIEVK